MRACIRNAMWVQSERLHGQLGCASVGRLAHKDSTHCTEAESYVKYSPGSAREAADYLDGPTLQKPATQ